MQIKVRNQRRLKLPEMEGVVARWYTGLRSSGPQLEAYRKQAQLLTAGLDSRADVLELAPGPGYLAIELARLGFTSWAWTSAGPSCRSRATTHTRRE